MNEKPEKDIAGTVFLVYVGIMSVIPLVTVIIMIAAK